jgi:hypothetical protein
MINYTIKYEIGKWSIKDFARRAIFLREPLESELSDGFAWNANLILWQCHRATLCVVLMLRQQKEVNPKG